MEAAAFWQRIKLYKRWKVSSA